MTPRAPRRRKSDKMTPLDILKYLIAAGALLGGGVSVGDRLYFKKSQAEVLKEKIHNIDKNVEKIHGILDPSVSSARRGK